MKKILAWMVAFSLLGVPALAEDLAQADDAQNAIRQGAPGERMKDPNRGEQPQGMEDGGLGGGRGGNMAQSEPDEALEAMLAEVQDAYQLLTFTDPQTGFEMQYELFAPENYDADIRYPMVMFIPDSRAAGREPAFSLLIGWGGVVWATKEEQAKHPCFVLIPIFTETVVNDNFETSDQIDTAVRLIESLEKTYPID